MKNHIGEVGQDVERLVPTAGDAFKIAVTGDLLLYASSPVGLS